MLRSVVGETSWRELVSRVIRSMDIDCLEEDVDADTD